MTYCSASIRDCHAIKPPLCLLDSWTNRASWLSSAGKIQGLRMLEYQSCKTSCWCHVQQGCKHLKLDIISPICSSRATRVALSDICIHLQYSGRVYFLVSSYHGSLWLTRSCTSKIPTNNSDENNFRWYPWCTYSKPSCPHSGAASLPIAARREDTTTRGAGDEQ
jgi:hypothetical protein